MNTEKTAICLECRCEFQANTRGRPRVFCSSACSDYAHAKERLRKAALAFSREGGTKTKVASDLFRLVHEVRSDG